MKTLSRAQCIKKKSIHKKSAEIKNKIMKKVNKTNSKEKSDKPLIPMGIKWQGKSDTVQNTPLNRLSMTMMMK